MHKKKKNLLRDSSVDLCVSALTYAILLIMRASFDLRLEALFT